MVVLEIQQVSGYAAKNLEQVKQQANGAVKRIESNDEKIVIYFNELTKIPTCISVESEKVMIVDNIQLAPAKAYAYYDPKSVKTVMYSPTLSGPAPTYCESCPACCICDATSFFKCADGGCRDGNVTCNGVNECADGSDETNCGVDCTAETFKCADGRCVLQSAKCNKLVDCRDGSDEIACPDMCNMAKKFTCANGQCVSEGAACNARIDCFDGSDELNCDKKNPNTGESKGNMAAKFVTSSTAIFLSIFCLLFVVV
jgi:hypothetical protein